MTTYITTYKGGIGYSRIKEHRERVPGDPPYQPPITATKGTWERRGDTWIWTNDDPSQ